MNYQVVFYTAAAIFCTGSSNIARAEDKFPAHIEKFDKCITLDSMRGVFAAKGASWTELTHVQFIFFRQVYLDSSRNKKRAEPGGSDAAAIILPDSRTVMIVFIGDGKICSGMQVTSDAIRKALEL